MNIQKVIRLLLPLVVEGVLKSQRHSHDRLVEKFDQLEFYTRNILSAQNETVIELQILDENLLYQLLAGEANKFLLASRVSHDRATQTQTNNAAWQIIEHYYSAYYAAHYLIRLTGISLTSLDSHATGFIKRNLLDSNNSISIPVGLYTLHYDDLNKMLILKKNTKNLGGSHQNAWQLWYKLIEKLMIKTNSDPVEYADTAIDLTTHKCFLSKSTGKYNPPELRGEINYQFKGSAWIFEKNATSSIKKIQRIILDAPPNNIVDSSSLEGLVSNNKIIISLARAIFLHSSDKYPKGICRSLTNKYKNYFE